jgi:hypothetical protein
MALTINQITEESLKVLEREMYNTAPYCLVVITLKDGTTQEIIIKIHPRDLHEIGAELKGGGGLTLDNDESAILVMADQIKHITIMKVTKEV